jgi:hypothetical protein
MRAAFRAAHTKLHQLVSYLTIIEFEAGGEERFMRICQVHKDVLEAMAPQSRANWYDLKGRTVRMERIYRDLSAMFAIGADQAADRERRKRQRQTAPGAKAKHESGPYRVIAAEIEPLWRKHPGWAAHRYACAITPAVNARVARPLKVDSIRKHVERFLREQRARIGRSYDRPTKRF